MEELTLIQHKIYEVRGNRIILDFDLAELYQVETRALNQAVKRNIERFPDDFMFRLTAKEWEGISSQFVMRSRMKRPKTALPLAFTEHGVIMLSSVLRSNVAAVDNLYQAIAELSLKSAEVEKPRKRIGFKHYDE